MKNDNVFVMCIVGRQHVGKSTFVKELLKDFKNENIIIYDVQNEYSEFYNNEFKEFQEFLECYENETNKIIVFEEASIFFKHNTSDKIITKMLVNVFHSGNIIILNFHSLRKIPKYILDLTHYITLFKTNDSLKKASELLEHNKYIESYIRVNENEDKHYHEVIEIID